DVLATKRMLDAHGLSARSGHFSVAMLDGQGERVVDIARRLGVEIVVAPYLSPAERPTTVEGWRALGARLLRIEARLSAAGLRFAWHNHDFEFEALADAFRSCMSRISRRRATRRMKTAGPMSGRELCLGPNSGGSASRRAP